jgi:excisionase family DNA binding protein
MASLAATPRRLISLAEAANALAVSTKTVRRYIAAGDLDAVRLGRRTIRVRVDSLDRLIDEHPVNTWRGRSNGGATDAQRRPRTAPTLDVLDHLAGAARNRWDHSEGVDLGAATTGRRDRAFLTAMRPRSSAPRGTLSSSEAGAPGGRHDEQSAR